MSTGTSILLIAAGAILRFAVTTTAKGLNLHTIGVILLVVGIVGLVISLVWMTVYAGRRRGPAVVERRDNMVVRDPNAY